MNVGYALGEAETRALLQQACAATGLSADGARLLRLGSNAVYRLAAPVVARIARPDADPETSAADGRCRPLARIGRLSGGARHRR